MVGSHNRRAFQYSLLEGIVLSLDSCQLGTILTGALKVVNSGDIEVPLKVDFDVAYKAVNGTIIVSYK